MGAWIVLVLVLAMGQEAAPPQAAVPVVEKADLCAVALAPKNYAGHYLELSGDVAGASTDKLMLTSKECHTAIALGFSDEAQEHEDVKTLFAAVRHGDGSRISGDFEGSLVMSEQGEIVRMQVDRIDGLRFPKGPAPKPDLPKPDLPKADAPKGEGPPS